MHQRTMHYRFRRKERRFFEPLHPSFFELTTALAFKYFAEQKVDIAIIEVGLGGRLDCTNIITPILSIITNISKDHTQFLGNTLADIAGEKQASSSQEYQSLSEKICQKHVPFSSKRHRKKTLLSFSPKMKTSRKSRKQNILMENGIHYPYMG